MNHLNKLIVKSLLEGCKSVRPGYNCNIAAINAVKNNHFRQYSDGSPVRKPSDYPLKSFLDGEKQSPETDDVLWSGVPSVKYETFDSSPSQVIYDITEEELGLSEGQEVEVDLKKHTTFNQVSHSRGRRGVFDHEELAQILNMDAGRDVVTLEIPPEKQWVEQITIATADSPKHLEALSQTVRKLYNVRKNRSDRALYLEGRDTQWVAMDLGNIALHIMSPQERKRIDMESLWINGPENDPKMIEILLQQEQDIYATYEDENEEELEGAPYDITKEYVHPFIPIEEEAVLPDFSEINDQNRNSKKWSATSILEIALRKHNGEHARKFRGRFKK